MKKFLIETWQRLNLPSPSYFKSLGIITTITAFLLGLPKGLVEFKAAMGLEHVPGAIQWLAENGPWFAFVMLPFLPKLAATNPANIVGKTDKLPFTADRIDKDFAKADAKIEQGQK